MKVLMISGKSMSGKDTFANMMRDNLTARGNEVLVIHFADAVKWLARDFLGWDGNKNDKGRSLLQNFATDTMREAYPTYWADIVAKFISGVHKWDYVLIPDWRFENEFETMYKYNDDIITMRIIRYNEEDKMYYNPNMRLSQLTHISETELDNFNFEYIIENHSFELLKDSADELSEMFENL